MLDAIAESMKNASAKHTAARNAAIGTGTIAITLDASRRGEVVTVGGGVHGTLVGVRLIGDTSLVYVAYSDAEYVPMCQAFDAAA